MMLIDGGGLGRRSPPASPPKPPPPPPPKRVTEAPVPSSQGTGSTVPHTAAQQREPLAAAAQNTQQKVTIAAQANNNVAQLESLPPQTRHQLQGEISSARSEASRTKAEARKAIQDELAVAKQLLSPAYYEDYSNAMDRDFSGNADEAAIVRDAKETATTPATEKSTAADASLAEIESKQAEVKQAETRYNETARSVENLPTHIRDLVLQPLYAARETKRTELADLIEADLNVAAKLPPRYPYDDRLASRAAQISGLDPGNARLEALVAATQQHVADTRATDAAVASVENTYNTEGAVAAAEELNAQTAWMTPSQAAMLIERLDGTIDKIGVDLGASDKSEQPDVDKAVAALSSAAEKGGTQSAAQIAESLTAGFSDEDIGVYPLGTHGNPNIPKYSSLNGALSLAIANGSGAALAVATSAELQATGRVEAANKVDQAIVNGVDKLRANHEEIQKQYAQREIQLQKELADFGPGLSADARKAYTEAYWANESIIPAGDEGDLPSNAEVRRQFAASDDQLAAALTAATPKLESMALAGDENAGEVLLDSYESLARTPAFAEQSVEWMKGVEANPALFEKLDGFVNDDLSVRFRDGIKADGIESMASQLLVDISYADEADRQGLIEGFLDKARQLDANGGYLDDIEQIAEINKNWQEYNRIRALPEGHPDRLKLTTLEGKLATGAEELLDDWAESNALGKSLAVVGLVVGFADTVDSFSNGDIPGGVLAAIGTGKDAAEVGIGILGVIGDGGRVAGLGAANFGTDAARVAGFAGKAADFGARYLPLVGLGLDAFQFSDDWKQLSTNPNAGEAIAAAGTAISLVGDVVEIVPFAGTILGGAIGAVGSLIHGVGGFVDGLIEGSEEQDALEARQRSNLVSAGLDEATAKAFVDMPQEIALLDNFDLAPEQVQSLMAQLGAGTDEQADVFTALSATAAAYGMKGDAAANLIGEAFKDHDIEKAAYEAPNGIGGFFIHTEGIKDGVDYEIQQVRTETITWLRENMPDVYQQYFSQYQTFSEPVSGFFEDYYQLLTTNDMNIAGKT
jgi:hypothetical protein